MSMYYVKRIFAVLLLCFSFVCSGQTIFYPQGLTSSYKVSRDTCGIAWDIHGVLAQPKDGKWKIYLKSLPGLLSSSFSFLSASIRGKKSKLRKALKERNNLPKDFDVSGEASYLIFKKYNLSSMVQITERIANAYKPMRGIGVIVHDIHSRGVQQRIASNIGPHFYELMKQNFAKRRSKIFDTIKLGKVVDYSRFGNGKNKSTLDKKYMTPQGKPLAAFYQEYTVSFNPTKKNTIILIDDKLENVRAAARAGWIGIHFTGTRKHGLAQLRKDLRALGVLS